MKRSHIFLILFAVILTGILVGTYLQGGKPATPARKAEAQTEKTNEAIRKKALDSAARLPVDTIKSRAWSDPDVR